MKYLSLILLFFSFFSCVQAHADTASGSLAPLDKGAVLSIITEKLLAKYEGEIDRTVDRLWAKIQLFPAREREEILLPIQRGIIKKIDQIRALRADEIRQKAVLDLLSYLSRSIEKLLTRTDWTNK